MSCENIEILPLDINNTEEVSIFLKNAIDYYYNLLEVKFDKIDFVCTKFELQNVVKTGLCIRNFLKNPDKKIEYNEKSEIISGIKAQQSLLDAMSWLVSNDFKP